LRAIPILKRLALPPPPPPPRNTPSAITCSRSRNLKLRALCVNAISPIATIYYYLLTIISRSFKIAAILTSRKAPRPRTLMRALEILRLYSTLCTCCLHSARSLPPQKRPMATRRRVYFIHGDYNLFNAPWVGRRSERIQSRLFPGYSFYTRTSSPLTY
jgi:hypothetical protein